MALRRRTGATVLALVAAAALTTSAGPARPAAARPAVPDGVTFSTPSGTKAQQDAIENRLIALIDGAARGSSISLSIYFLRAGAVVDALLRAHGERQVRVRVVVDERNTWEPPRDTALQPGQVRVPNPGVGKLKAALGTTTSAPSFVRVCTADGACIGKKGTPKNHNKFFLFSDTLGTKNVVVQGSGNISPSTRQTNFNEAVTFGGNAALYATYQRYFTDLVAMRKTDNYYKTAVSGPVKSYFFPRRGRTAWEPATDDVYQVLNHVACKGNKKVGTSKHRTIIRVNMFELNRSDIAHKLWDLDKQGCHVEIIYTAVSSYAEGILTKKAGAHNGPVVRCSKFVYPMRDENGQPVLGPDGKPKKQGAFTHDKYLLIEGVYYGKRDRKIILTGSHNYSYSALRENDETLLRIDSPALHDAYRYGFGRVRAEMKKYGPAPLRACHSPSQDRTARNFLPKPAETELERELQDEYEN